MRRDPLSHPVPLSELIRSLRADLLELPDPLRRAWAAAAGEVAAAHTVALRVRGATLLVQTDTDAWARQLEALSGPVLERLLRQPETALIQSMRVRAASPPPAGPGGGSPRGRNAGRA